jgi:hypothetical protein
MKKLKEQLVPVQIVGFKEGFIMMKSDRVLKTATPPKSQAVNLLPSLDSYVMGYKERERCILNE